MPASLAPVEEAALLAQALLAVPGHKLPLLPAGEASIEKRSELKINANGQSRTVVQYAISGLGFVPSALWLDAGRKVFRLGFNLVFHHSGRLGKRNSDLLKEQDKFENERSGSWPARWLTNLKARWFLFTPICLIPSQRKCCPTALW